MSTSLLIDELPETICVEGKEYDIDTDFSTFILLEQLLSDRGISDNLRMRETWSLLFPFDTVPPLSEETLKQIEWFYRCGKVESERRKSEIAKRTNKAKKLNDQIYDFEFDDQYIFAAFMSCYGIDLTECSMHWWKFKALFNSLDSDCEFVKIMGYRSADVGKIKDKEEKARIVRLQAMYAIPSKLTAEEKAARIGSMF